MPTNNIEFWADDSNESQEIKVLLVAQKFNVDHIFTASHSPTIFFNNTFVSGGGYIKAFFNLGGSNKLHDFRPAVVKKAL